MFYSIWSEASDSIIYSNKIRPEHQKLIEQDLRRLEEISQLDDPYLQWILELDVLNGKSLKNWLLERFKVIISEKEDYWNMMKIIKNQEYPHGDITPLELKETLNYNADDLIQSDFKAPPFSREDLHFHISATTLMSNVGSAMYYRGKSEKKLYSFKFTDQKGNKISLKVDSPRVGVFQVGRGFFHPKTQVSEDLASEANSILRLATLLHEARHSDGNGKSLGFFHQVCEDHEKMAGESACDRSLNGPYLIDGLFLRSASKLCKTCTSSEIEFLIARANDSLSRVTKKSLAYKDWKDIPDILFKITELDNKKATGQISVEDYDYLVRKLQQPKLQWIPANFYDASPELIIKH